MPNSLRRIQHNYAGAAAAYPSTARIARGDTSRSERLRLACRCTSFPGLSTVTLPPFTLAATFRSSMTMTPWFLAISLIDLCTESFRRRAYLASNLATPRWALA